MLVTRGLQRLQVGPIDFDLATGTCVSITGPSGAGKSLLLRMIADLDPHVGDCTLDGRACSAMPAPAWRRLVTYVAAESGWWLPQVAAHFPPATDFGALFGTLGIPAEAARWPVTRLSTGERQRLALLRAIAQDPRILLLDEPTSGLDTESMIRVESLLTDRLRSGTGILMVTHDAAQAMRMGTRHLVLRNGTLEAAA